MAALPMLTNATTTETGEAIPSSQALSTFQATGTTSSGTGAATVAIEASNDLVGWLTLGTISLTLGTTETSDGFASQDVWQNFRARVTAISGTGASVTVTMGV